MCKILSYVINLDTVKIKEDKYWLLGVTFVFLVLGSFVVYFSIQKIVGISNCNFNGNEYGNDVEVPGYKEGYVCKCINGDVKCEEIIDSSTLPSLDKFTRNNLKTTPKYLISGTKEQISSSPLKTKFVSISSKNNSINITIEQEQKCTPELKIPVQIGMYYFVKDKLYLTNIVNKSPNLYTENCIVSVSYQISNWKYKGNNLSVTYWAEDGSEHKAMVCNYDNNVFSEGDVYSSIDKCNICKCISGISKCSNDRVCSN